MKAWPLYMICLLCCNAYSQQFPNIQFNYLTAKEGLSSNIVTCIAQDDEGFIWIGTGDGLNRFDGYRVKNFFHSPGNKNSLVNNAVYRIIPDGRNNLWITTREGLSFYHKQTGMFRNFRHNPADTSSLDDDQYTTLYVGRNNSAWVTTSSSLYFFDSSYQYRRISRGANGLSGVKQNGSDLYQKVTRDRQGRLWAFKTEYLFLLDPGTMRVARTFGPINGNIEVIYQGSDLQVWIGTFGAGLARLNVESGQIIPVRLANSSDVIHSLTEWTDPHNNRWLAVASDRGLVLVDPVSLRTKEYDFHLGYFPQDIVAQNDLNCVFADKQNILWVGTQAGVCYAKPSRQLFDLWNISNISGTAADSISDWIYSICEVSDGYWMARWIGPGLLHFNKEGKLTEKVLSIPANGGSRSLGDTMKPYYIANQGDSVLWFTTYDRLVHYDLRSRKALQYKPPDATAMTGLRTILMVDDHTWWIRTRNNGPNGIYIFDPIARKFTKHFTNSPGCNDCVPPDLLTIFLSRKKEIYVTAVGKGLFKYDAATSHFVSVFKFEGSDLMRHSNSFECVAEDSSGLLWITGYAGVFVFDPISRKVVRDFANNELLGGVEISSVIFDKQQNVWLNAERGIFYILHASDEVRKLTNTEGLTNNSNGTFQQGKDGSIYSGIQGFVIRFQPSDMLHYTGQKSAVHFSDASVMDAPSSFHFRSSGQKEMIIPPGENRFSLDFSVMNYDGANRYYYKLDGLMNAWQQNENGHLAFYNLPPGTYTLQVKGGNEYGELPGNEDEVVIVVKPHWWQTDWFKFACAIFIIALATFLIRKRIMHIRQEASFKQKMAETEMMALRSQMNPHFIFNSLNSIENFMMQNEKRLASSYLNKFARLIRMILDSSRNELVPVSKDIEALRLYVDLEQLRFNHKFCFNLQIDPLLVNGDYKVPALLIQPYVENAIIHGLAHSEKNDLALTVSARLEGEYIHYGIHDNGIGRKLSAQYNHQNKPHHKSVGLKITEERIHIFNQKQNAIGRVNITDQFDQAGQPSGTMVDITIKAA